MVITEDERTNRRTFMSGLATRHEPIISETLWTHRRRNSELDNELLIAFTDFREKLIGKVNLAIKSATSVQVRNDAIEDAYQNMFRVEKGLEFLRLVDKSTGSDLEQIAKGFISQTAPGFVDVKIRFVVEEALVLAKQRLKKPRFPVKGTLLPNIRINQNGSEILATQIDGAIVQTGVNALIVKSRMAYYWAQVEIKSYHNIDWAITDSPSQMPHKIHLDQFHQRLEALYILCQEKGIDFALPSHIIFCYLRGLKDDVFYTIPIGISHLVQWKYDIESRSLRESRELTRNEKRVLKYIDGEVKVRQRKLKKGMKLVKRKKVIKGSNEVFPKLELPEKKRRERNQRLPMPELLDKSSEQAPLDLLQTLEPEPKQKYEIVWNPESKRILRDLLKEIGCSQDVIGGIRRRRKQKQFKLPINVFNNCHPAEGDDFFVTLSLPTFLRDLHKSIAKYSTRPFTEDSNLLSLAEIFEGDKISLLLSCAKTKNKYYLKQVKLELATPF